MCFLKEHNQIHCLVVYIYASNAGRKNLPLLHCVDLACFYLRTHSIKEPSTGLIDTVIFPPWITCHLYFKACVSLPHKSMWFPASFVPLLVQTVVTKLTGWYKMIPKSLPLHWRELPLCWWNNKYNDNNNQYLLCVYSPPALYWVLFLHCLIFPQYSY